VTELELADWRRQVAQLYAAVRDQETGAVAHRLWREGRGRLFREHPQSPLAPSDPLRVSGLPYWPYDPDLRFELPVIPAPERRLALPSGNDDTTSLRRIGLIRIPSPLDTGPGWSTGNASHAWRAASSAALRAFNN